MGINMYKINGLITVALLGLTACGGGGGGGPSVPTSKGVFKDSTVQGLNYESGGQKSVTNSLGGFIYEDDEDISFSVGGVVLGTAKGKSLMTPLDLVTGGQLATPEVINRVRFLMMLDKDNKPSNGIVISPAVQNIAKDWAEIDFAATDFQAQILNRNLTAKATLADGELHELPDVATATAHIRNTLLCANAGAFKGTYTGTESGRLVFVVDPVSGEVNGSSYNPVNQVSVEVNSTTVIDYDLGLEFVSEEDSAKAFSGTLQTSDDMDGTWLNSSVENVNGAFTATRFGSKSDSIYRYVAFFNGGDKGVFTFNIDAANNVSGTVYSITNETENDLTGTLTSTIDSQNNYKLSATSPEGDIINGFIDADTLAFATGGWSNGRQGTGGSFS